MFAHGLNEGGVGGEGYDLGDLGIHFSLDGGVEGLGEQAEGEGKKAEGGEDSREDGDHGACGGWRVLEVKTGSRVIGTGSGFFKGCGAGIKKRNMGYCRS